MYNATVCRVTTAPTAVHGLSAGEYSTTTTFRNYGSVSRRDSMDNGEAKPSKHEVRRAEAAIKRQKMLEEQQREKDKVKDRLDLIRQMKGKRCTLIQAWSIR